MAQNRIPYAVINAELGSAEWFTEQADLIKSRRMVKYCYDSWYSKQSSDFQSVSNRNDSKAIELGSGGSYLSQFIPQLVLTDVVGRDGVVQVDAQNLPFESGSLSAIFMSHVLHHIPNVTRFFEEAERALIPGGVISLIEVAHTPLARFIFKNFHTEPYDDKSKEWVFDSKHNMDANQALSWLVFVRDRKKFEAIFPNLKIELFSYLPWFTYLVSGGVTKPQLIPRFLEPLAIAIEPLLRIFAPFCSLHWHIRIRKKR